VGERERQNTPNCRHCGVRMKLVRELMASTSSDTTVPVRWRGHVDMIEWPDAEGKDSS
jgi:hypothetical protein